VTRTGADENDQITGAAMSPDNDWVALRTHTQVKVFRAETFLRGIWREEARVDISDLQEPQGEGVALGPNNTLFLTGEGGGDSKPGTFWRLSCPPIR
jgi:hypothetical protein